MQQTRRHFLMLTGGVLAAFASFGMGFGVFKSNRLKGKVFFEDWRSLPGLDVVLQIDLPKPEHKKVEIYALLDGQKRRIDAFSGQELVRYTVPSLHTESESYELVAVVSDFWGRRCESEPLEVLAKSYQFGM